MRISLALLMLLVGTVADAQIVSSFDVAGFKLGTGRDVFERNAKRDQKAIDDFNDYLIASGAMSGPGRMKPIADWQYQRNANGTSRASVPTPSGRVEIVFLCSELGGNSVEIAQTRNLENLTTDDIKDALLRKYGKPRIMFRASLASGKPNLNDLSLIWSDKPPQITKREVENWAENGGMYTGPGLSVRIVGTDSHKRVYLHLQAENAEQDSRQCTELADKARNERAVQQLRF